MTGDCIFRMEELGSLVPRPGVMDLVRQMDEVAEDSALRGFAGTGPHSLAEFAALKGGA